MPDLPDDYVPLIQAIVTGTFVIGAALLTTVLTWLARLNVRLRKLEQRDRLSWLYIRSLINHLYKYSDVEKYPLPEPPEGWLNPEEV